MTTCKSKTTVSLPTGPILYELLGNGELIVLVHGGWLDHTAWDDQFYALARSYRVLRYDIRGHGSSPETEAEYSLSEELAGLLDQLREGPAHIVGLSLGARIAVDLALERPELVRSLVLCAPGVSGYSFSADVVEGFKAIGKCLAKGSLGDALDLIMQNPLWHQDVPSLDARVRALVTSHLTCHYPSRNRLREPATPAIGRLGEIAVPTLVLVGDADILDIHQIARQLASNIAGARLHVIAGAGHMLNMQVPAEFNRLVCEFLSDAPVRA